MRHNSEKKILRTIHECLDGMNVQMWMWMRKKRH